MRSCHIRKNAFAYTFEPKLWDYSIPVLKVSFWKSNSNVSILVGVMMTLSALIPLYINEMKEVMFDIRFNISTVTKNVRNMANLVAQTLLRRRVFVASHLGLHYL